MGPDRTGANGPDPTRPHGQGCLVESGTGVEAENEHLHLNAGGGSGTKREGGEMGPIAPALTARIPLDPSAKGVWSRAAPGWVTLREAPLLGPS
ncbi:hypothetical protein Ancab_025138 [Ancistrocladus abbreviatus]